MTGSHTRYSAGDGVARLTLARPDVRNAITSDEVIDEIVQAVRAAGADSSLSVLVIDADGPAFSAGGDVRAMRRRDGMFAGHPHEIASAYRSGIQEMTRAVYEVDLVTIAAVQGPAIGAGFDLAIGCDLRVGTPAARFGHTFAELGIIPGDGGAWLLPRVVGWQRAAELAFTGRIVEAGEAERLGILLEVVPADDLAATVGRIASTIASRSRPAIRLTKRLLRHARTMEFDAFLDMTAAYQALAHASPDHEAAMEEFFARRPRLSAEPKSPS